MRVVDNNALSISIYKVGAYDETVNFTAGETIRTVFQRAGVDYEEWTLGWVAYTPESELEESDNNAVITITTKQVKQG